MSKKQKLKSLNLDSLRGVCGGNKSSSDLHLAMSEKKENSAIFFSKNGIVDKFFTDDSKLYLTPSELRKMRKGGRIVRTIGRLDNVFSREFEKTKIYSIGHSDVASLRVRRVYLRLRNYAVNLVEDATGGISMSKMWNLSIVGAVIFGMFTMTMIYRYMGQNVSAKMEDAAKNSEISRQEEMIGDKETANINDDIDVEYITRIIENEDGGEKIKKKDFEKEIMNMVSGYPIEEMVPEIVKQDRVVAAFLIAIAKKESNWGKRVPVLNGENCYNYWGYRGIRDRMGTGGHTCFDSPKDAVETVGKRIEYLVSETKRNTPDKMVVWKCGYDCSWDNKTSVRKWISDVDLYFRKLNKD